MQAAKLPRFSNSLLLSLLLVKRSSSRCHYSLSSIISRESELKHDYDDEKGEIRNFGIVAHIDSGKTTMTERILYAAKVIKQPGNVDNGDTTTDFLPEERERGITIQSAAITLPWKSWNYNLIDTPGHVDFSFEVERSLRVMDGAVVLVDAVAGVQAQTRTVFKQASQQNLPIIFFINKMDRENADLQKAIGTLSTHLSIPQKSLLLLHSPLHSSSSSNISMEQKEEEEEIGLFDLVSMAKYTWDGNDCFSLNTSKIPWPSSSDNNNDGNDSLKSQRLSLIEKVAEFYEPVADKYLMGEDVSPELLMKGIRHICVNRLGYPILFGSAFKHWGVQPLLDAIGDYFPSPLGIDKQRLDPNGKLIALAFKVRLFDPARGPLVFFRVYSGTIHSRQNVINVCQDGESERPLKLLQIHADEMREVDSISAGNIGAAIGMKLTRTGDTLIDTNSVNNVNDNINDFRLPGIQVPPSVFICAIEADSSSDEPKMLEALRLIEREDPSVTVSWDEETGQTRISGLGELHLEIIRHRLTRDLGVKCRMSPVRISYRETVAETIDEWFNFTTLQKPGGSISVRLKISEIVGNEGMKEIYKEYDSLISKQRQNQQQQHQQSRLIKKTSGTSLNSGFAPPMLFHQFGINNNCIFVCSLPSPYYTQVNFRDLVITPGNVNSLRRGIEDSFSRGPLLSFPLVSSFVELIDVKIENFMDSADKLKPLYRACGSSVGRQALNKSSSFLLEPFMNIQVQVPSQYLGAVLGDLNGARKASVTDIRHETGQSVIDAEVPLSTLINYSNALRSITAGSASFTMDLGHHQKVRREDQERIVKEGLGL